MTEHDIVYFILAGLVLLSGFLSIKYYIRPTIRKRVDRVRKFFRKRIMSFKKRRRMRKASRGARRQVRKLLDKFKMND